MIITHGDLAWTRRRFKNKKIVYCSGSFDLPHLGHALLFKKCKSLGDILVVNVGCDYDISQSKPGRPIMPQLIRLRTVNEFKPVDFCFLGKRLLKSQNSQARVVEIFKSLQPDIYAINDDASDMTYRRQVAEECGVKLVVLKPVHPVGYPEFSATWIVEKITRITRKALK